MEDPNLNVIQAALKMYMLESRLLRLRAIGLFLLALIVVAAGIEPMSYPAVRVLLVAFFTVAYVFTLYFTREPQGE